MGVGNLQINSENECSRDAAAGSSEKIASKKGRTQATLQELQARDAQTLLEGVRGMQRGRKVAEGEGCSTGGGSVAPGRRELGEAPQASMSFAGDAHLEQAFVIWTAQNCQGFSLRMHTMIILVFLMGFLKSCIMLSYGHGLPTQVTLLGAIQLAVVVHEVSQLRKLVSNDYKSQIEHENVKAKMHALLHFGSMAALLLSSEGMASSLLHVYAMIFLVCLSIGDMVPMRHLIRLHIIKIVCMVTVMVVGLVHGDLGMSSLIKSVIMGAVFGTIVPLGFACCFECRQRLCFLHVCEKPTTHLGPLWSKVARLCMNMANSARNFY